MLSVRATSCCALQEISELQAHLEPDDAMERFVLLQGKNGNGDPMPAGLVLFTGVIRHTDTTKAVSNFTYGPKFAAYIRKHKLGLVRGSFSNTNVQNHPNHVVRAWVWCPDRKALAKWWKERKDSFPELKALPLTRVHFGIVPGRVAPADPNGYGLGLPPARVPQPVFQGSVVLQGQQNVVIGGM